MKQEQLIHNLREGLEEAYELLFKNYYTELVIHANRYLYDFETSKEIVQDLIVHIYEKRHNLDINSSLKSYLYRSVQNRCINYINAQKTRDKYVNYIKYTKLDNDTLTEKQIEASEMEQALFTAIDELPPKCRMIFKMNRFEGYSNSDIAERLELSKRTVETQITKALKILRSKLHKYMIETVLLLMAFEYFNF